MQVQHHLFERTLTIEDLQRVALEFAANVAIRVDTTGPRLGEIIEARFREYLEGVGYHVPKSGRSGDLSDLNVDIKSLQLHGRRGGSPKLHGYSKTGPPSYDLLVFGYTYRDQTIHVTTV